MRRFQAFVNRTDALTTCHNWTGARDRAGYGRFRTEAGGSPLAHRWLLGKQRGYPLAKTEMACHHCDNPACVNLAHLYVGNALTNSRDLIRRHGHYLGNQTRCKRGHPLNGQNLYIQPSTQGRHCRQCRKVRASRSRANAGNC